MGSYSIVLFFDKSASIIRFSVEWSTADNTSSKIWLGVLEEYTLVIAFAFAHRITLGLFRNLYPSCFQNSQYLLRLRHQRTFAICLSDLQNFEVKLFERNRKKSALIGANPIIFLIPVEICLNVDVVNSTLPSEDRIFL